jgi:ribosomal protein L34E
MRGFKEQDFDALLRKNICHDCGNTLHGISFDCGRGNRRCLPCTVAFDEAKKAEECEHDFDPYEGFHCLNCGKDGTEEVMSKAYDRAKDRRKYGD